MTKRSGNFAAVAVAGLVATKLAQIAILTTATLAPDPATGRTVAVIFAPAFQSAPAYVTPLQSSMAFGLAMIAVAGGLGWVASLVLERLGSPLRQQASP